MTSIPDTNEKSRLLAIVEEPKSFGPCNNPDGVNLIAYYDKPIENGSLTRKLAISNYGSEAIYFKVNIRNEQLREFEVSSNHGYKEDDSDWLWREEKLEPSNTATFLLNADDQNPFTIRFAYYRGKFRAPRFILANFAEHGNIPLGCLP